MVQYIRHQMKRKSEKQNTKQNRLDNKITDQQITLFSQLKWNAKSELNDTC